ncbi:DUF3231 family protein [Neobacillus sp. OS1-2]|uniref:DUF3231 family protein n=1 Tax=Neobacillus sp. OS1-2 TaxID=3070680 RepID=UPI0027E0BBDE|nr:DUF3231 family protein [Neobacillus sp. OS1-2]WML38266.1 DUF3231 family protein [Neobacillus sp. OS1-2]
MEHQHVHLTSSEIACLWTAYLNDSMSKCVLTFMINHIQDTDIKPVIQFALNISTDHLNFLHTLFEKEQFAYPNGFTDSDVNVNAPWLFTDTFCLSYVNHMAKVGMLAYGGFLAMSTRTDIRAYFTEELKKITTLYNQALDIGLQKGVVARHPYIEVPKETDYVDSKKYLSGLNPFSKKRPLNAVEISHLYMNTVTNAIGVKLCLAFAQTSPTKEVQEFMLRGKEISQKHIQIFVSTLLDNNIETPNLPDLSISHSTSQTFSDKLLMFHMSLLSASGTGNYATAAAASQRTDLALNYERLSIEIAQFAKSGADIMIKNNWLEQPPGTKDRIELAKKKEG